MLLALDIGNTNITFGVFGENSEPQDNTPIATWRIATDRARLADEYGLLLSNLLSLKGIQTEHISAVALCSGVPPLTQVFIELCTTYFQQDPMVIGPGIRTGIKILYDNT